MSTCDKTVSFDNHGDIELQVSGGTTRYIVCSRALARTSPSLLSQVRQNVVADTQDGRSAIIQLNGNDDDSLTILFNIAHAHFLAVPRTLSIKQLYNLSVLTSCYNCTSILGPWVDAWIAGVEGMVRRDDVAMMLWVFWELGFSGDFRTMAHRMTVELDACEFTDAARLWSSARATSVIARLSDLRLASLQALFDTMADMLAKLLLLEQCPRWSRFAARGGPQRCRLAMRAMMESSLGAAGLWPLPEVGGMKESLAEVYSKLVAVVSHNHMGCEFGQFWCRRIQDAMNAQLDQISGIKKDECTLKLNK